MSMNLNCVAIYPDGTTSTIPIWQTSTDESWDVIGCAHDFSNHQGAEPYLTLYLESRLKRLVRSADTSLASEYLMHIQEITLYVVTAVYKGATIEWYVS